MPDSNQYQWAVDGCVDAMNSLASIEARLRLILDTYYPFDVERRGARLSIARDARDLLLTDLRAVRVLTTAAKDDLAARAVAYLLEHDQGATAPEVVP